MTAHAIIAPGVAERLFAGEAALLHAERGLEVVLYGVYGAQPGDWTSYSYDRTERRLDVYGVAPRPTAVDALQRAGFAVVVEHEHPEEQFVRCACREWRAL